MKHRAQLIASTESTLVIAKADVWAWGQTGVVEGKEWFTAEDGHVCGWCDEMDKE